MDNNDQIDYIELYSGFVNVLNTVGQQDLVKRLEFGFNNRVFADPPISDKEKAALTFGFIRNMYQLMTVQNTLNNLNGDYIPHIDDADLKKIKEVIDRFELLFA